MIEFLSAETIKYWPELATWRKYALEGREIDQKRYLSFISELNDILNSDLADEDPLFFQVVNRIKQYIPLLCDSRTALSVQEKKLLIEKCDECRMRFLSLLLASSEERIGKDETLALATEDGKARNAIVYGAGGIVYSRFERSWVILMPDIGTSLQCNEILDELLRIHDLSIDCGVLKWIIDFSAVSKLPIILIGTLLGYRIGLPPHDIALCWLKDKILNSLSLEVICEKFKCEQIGGYWFTK